MWNFPHVPNLGQDLTLMLRTSRNNASRREPRPLKTVANSVNRIVIACKVVETCQFMGFGILSYFQAKRPESIFLVTRLKAI